MADPIFQDATTAFLNGPYVLVATSAIKDIADRVFPAEKLPKVDAFIDRFVNPSLPVVLGAIYGYFTAPAGTSRLTSGINGFQMGLAASGLYRSWGVIVHGK